MRTKRATKPAAPPPPPQDYGANTWADDGPWAVPAELRSYYVDAEPSDVEKSGYLQGGAHVVETRSVEIDRVADPGDDKRAPRVVTETITQDTLAHKTGPSYYPRWLHAKRLDLAARRKGEADARTAREAAWPVCQMCGTKAPTVRPVVLPQADAIDFARRIRAVLCPECRPVADHVAYEAFVARDAERVLPDQRTARDAAAKLVAALLAKDGPR